MRQNDLIYTTSFFALKEGKCKLYIYLNDPWIRYNSSKQILGLLFSLEFNWLLGKRISYWLLGKQISKAYQIGCAFLRLKQDREKLKASLLYNFGSLQFSRGNSFIACNIECEGIYLVITLVDCCWLWLFPLQLFY